MNENISGTGKSVYKEYFQAKEEGFDIIDARNYKNASYRGEQMVDFKGMDQEQLMATPFKHNGNYVYAHAVVPIERQDGSLSTDAKRLASVNTIEFYEDTTPDRPGFPTVKNYCPEGCRSLSEPIATEGFELNGTHVSYDEAKETVREKAKIMSSCEHVMSYQEYSDMTDYKNMVLYQKHIKYGEEVAKQFQLEASPEKYEEYLQREESKQNINGRGYTDYAYVGRPGETVQGQIDTYRMDMTYNTDPEFKKFMDGPSDFGDE